MFAQAPQVAADAEALLVDECWAEPEPVAPEVTPTAMTSGDARGDGGEVQRSLFSWAEFMAEGEVKPQPHRDEAPTLSLSSGHSRMRDHGAVS